MIDRQKDEQYHEMLNNGEMYDSVDDEFIAYQHELVQRLNDFNRTDETPEGLKERDEILKEICGTYGEDLYVSPPVSATAACVTYTSASAWWCARPMVAWLVQELQLQLRG